MRLFKAPYRLITAVAFAASLAAPSAIAQAPLSTTNLASSSLITLSVTQRGYSTGKRFANINNRRSPLKFNRGYSNPRKANFAARRSNFSNNRSYRGQSLHRNVRAQHARFINTQQRQSFNRRNDFRRQNVQFRNQNNVRRDIRRRQNINRNDLRRRQNVTRNNARSVNRVVRNNFARNNFRSSPVRSTFISRPVFANSGFSHGFGASSFYRVGGVYNFGRNSRVIHNYRSFGLYDPPYGYCWVRDVNRGDAILASVATGAIIGLAAGVFASY